MPTPEVARPTDLEDACFWSGPATRGQCGKQEATDPGASVFQTRTQPLGQTISKALVDTLSSDLEVILYSPSHLRDHGPLVCLLMEREPEQVKAQFLSPSHSLAELAG